MLENKRLRVNLRGADGRTEAFEGRVGWLSPDNTLFQLTEVTHYFRTIDPRQGGAMVPVEESHADVMISTHSASFYNAVILD